MGYLKNINIIPKNNFNEELTKHKQSEAEKNFKFDVDQTPEGLAHLFLLLFIFVNKRFDGAEKQFQRLFFDSKIPTGSRRTVFITLGLDVVPNTRKENIIIYSILRVHSQSFFLC